MDTHIPHIPASTIIHEDDGGSSPSQLFCVCFILFFPLKLSSLQCLVPSNPRVNGQRRRWRTVVCAFVLHYVFIRRLRWVSTPSTLQFCTVGMLPRDVMKVMNYPGDSLQPVLPSPSSTRDGDYLSCLEPLLFLSERPHQFISLSANELSGLQVLGTRRDKTH